MPYHGPFFSFIDFDPEKVVSVVFFVRALTLAANTFENNEFRKLLMHVQIVYSIFYQLLGRYDNQTNMF